VLITTNRFSFSSILSNGLSPPYVVFICILFLSLSFPPWEIHSFTNPRFLGASSDQIPHLALVKISLEVTQTCFPLMESWPTIFNLVVPFVFQHLIYKKFVHLEFNYSIILGKYYTNHNNRRQNHTKNRRIDYIHP
jgi:hypothetical protein